MTGSINANHLFHALFQGFFGLEEEGKRLCSEPCGAHPSLGVEARALRSSAATHFRVPGKLRHSFIAVRIPEDYCQEQYWKFSLRRVVNNITWKILSHVLNVQSSDVWASIHFCLAYSLTSSISFDCFAAFRRRSASMFSPALNVRASRSSLPVSSVLLNSVLRQNLPKLPD